MSEQENIRLPQPESSAQPSEADAGRMLQILWRGKWILLVVPALAFLGAKLWLDAQTELFVATAQIQVDSREPNPLKSGVGEAIDKPRTVLKQQQALFKATALLKPIADSPALAGLKSFAPERLGDKSVVGELYDNLQTSIDVESNRLIVSYTSPFRDETVKVVDEAVRVYLDHQRESKRKQTQLELDIVRSTWEKTQKDLDAAQKEMDELQAQNSLIVGTERSPLQAKLDSANQSLNQAKLESAKQKSIHDDMLAARQKDAQTFRERGAYWRSKGPIQSLEERAATLKNEREAKQQELDGLRLHSVGDQNPRLLKLQEGIRAIQAEEANLDQRYAEEYLRNSGVDYDKARFYQQTLQDDVDGLLGQITEENQVLARLKNLETERNQLREQVTNFGDRIRQLTVETQTGALNLDVIENARAAMRPVFPDGEKTMIYALGAGGILAFALVLLLGLSDRRVREVEDVPRLLGTSVLGVLPQMPGGTARTKIARLSEEDPLSLVAEAIRSARTATIFALPNGGRGVVLVTSASAGEGKSVCASNLACALAKAGKKTLLVDADMRNPAQHEIYSVENGIGLAGLLMSSAAVKKAIVPSAALGLDLLPAGHPSGKAAELCEGQVLQELLRTLRESYEIIVIDSPPVLETSEARVLASLSDAVVFVLRLDRSRAPNLKRAAGILRSVGARILGALPNGAASKRGARAYSGGISYGSGPPPSAPAARPRAGGEGGAQNSDGRGTDFLGLEEESA